MSKSETREIELSIELDAPPEAVWRAVSEGAELAKWLAPEAKVTPGASGTIFISWGEGMGVESKITAWEPNRRMRHEFGENRDTKAKLWVDWSIASDDGKHTTLRMVHSGFGTGADWDEEYESHARGWTIFLRNLLHYLHTHDRQAAVQQMFTVRTAKSRDQVWEALRLPAWREGDAYRFEGLSGTVDVFRPARDFGGTVAELDGGLLRISLEKGKEGTLVYGVVLAYGDAAGRARELADRLGEIIGQRLSP